MTTRSMRPRLRRPADPLWRRFSHNASYQVTGSNIGAAAEEDIKSADADQVGSYRLTIYGQAQVTGPSRAARQGRFATLYVALYVRDSNLSKSQVSFQDARLIRRLRGFVIGTTPTAWETKLPVFNVRPNQRASVLVYQVGLDSGYEMHMRMVIAGTTKTVEIQ